MKDTKDFIPRPDQQYCFNRIIDTPYIGLFLGMSMGKTVVTLSAIDALMHRRLEVAKPLIVAPRQVSLRTWQNEAKKWTHLQHLTFQLISGTPAHRVNQLDAAADIFIISRDMLWWLVDYYGKAWPFDMVVLDESSSFKSASSRRTKSMLKARPFCNRVVLLTGTPAPQSYEDLFSQLKILDMGQRLRVTKTDFKREFMCPTRPVKHGSAIMRYEMRPGAKEDIDERISDIVVCLKSSDYVNLPDIIYEKYPVALSTMARKAYDRFEHDLLLELANNVEVFATEQSTVGMKLHQLCQGAIYDSDKEYHLVHDRKLEWLLETLEALLYEQRHCLVYYAFQFDLDMVLGAIADKYAVRVLKTAQDEQDWNDGKIEVLLAHPASCAYGLNLQYGGSEIIWYGLTSNLELFEQGNMRLPRNGASRPVTIHVPLVENSRDEEIMELLDKKADVQNGLKENLQRKVKLLAGELLKGGDV